jgi:hypothetical protein
VVWFCEHGNEPLDLVNSKVVITIMLQFLSLFDDDAASEMF